MKKSNSFSNLVALIMLMVLILVHQVNSDSEYFRFKMKIWQQGHLEELYVSR